MLTKTKPKPHHAELTCPNGCGILKALQEELRKGPKPERNGIYKHPMRFVLFHSDDVSASVLLAQDASGEKPWHSGYELTGVRGEVAYSAPPIVASHYTTAHIAVMAAADAVDQRLQDVIRAADYTPRAKTSCRRARKALQKTREEVGRLAQKGSKLEPA